MNINYGIVAVHNGEIVHFTGYEKFPTKNDIENLMFGFMCDEELGFVHIFDELDFRMATKEEILNHREIYSEIEV